jgi:hypothetical protein
MSGISQSGSMTHTRFMHLLQTYGADFARWPAPDQQPGRALRDESAAMQEQWRQALVLDALFAADRKACEPEEVRRDAVVQRAMARLHALPERGIEWRWLLGRRVSWAMGAMIIAGFISGLLTTPEVQRQQRHSVPLMTALVAYDLLAGEGAFP